MFLCEVYVCVNIPSPGPVGELYMTAYNVFLAFAGLNQGQKGPRISSSLSLDSSFKGSPRRCPPAVLWVAKGDVENWLLEIQSCETSLSPFSNEFPDRQMCSQF